MNTSVRSALKKVLKKGTRSIAPLWSLENFVAVNPYLGLSSAHFDDAMAFLNTCAGAEATLPVTFYLEALEKGRLSKEDIAETLKRNNLGVKVDTDTFIQDLYKVQSQSNSLRIATVMDVASEINGKKWRRFMIDRISHWASAYFDEKQALWKTTTKSNSLFKAWKRDAEIDLSPRAMGLKGFRKLVRSLPNDHVEAASQALSMLDIPDQMLEHYLSSLLLKMNGWAGFAARVDWDAGLKGEESNMLEEFLVILLIWEMSLKQLLHYPDMDSQWRQAKSETMAVIEQNGPDESLSQKLILQQAFDLANQRKLIGAINGVKVKSQRDSIPEVQAVFCIDVRSEVIRRNLEAAHNDIETMGFAGFFGFPVTHQQLGQDEGTDQCPVLLTTSHTVRERMQSIEINNRVIDDLQLRALLSRAWKSFKSGAISCFSFVSPLGLFFLPKLITDSLGLTRPVAQPNRSGLTNYQLKHKRVELDVTKTAKKETGIPMNDRVQLAANALKGMSLTEKFAPIVLLVGHGASTTNNPHATGLDCGACGGNSGEANAKVAAATLNDLDVRRKLVDQGIEIPSSTLFVPALHDTTTDAISLFPTGKISDWHQKHLNELSIAIQIAGEVSRRERAVRMNVKGKDINKRVIQRSKDWSQVRPEWGLAGCSSFIVAPRERTSQLNLEGKSFMHSYDWKKDTDFGVLELIMTAPMVVTSWINLQYYASTVDNKRFGSGNKTLHNVVGGLGVLEGFAGDLRVGLPHQSVHDGEKYQHEPQRLNVFIEAPVDEMSKILAKHESIRQLCDNEWIFLFAMNEEGRVAYQYIGNLEWEVVE